MTWRATLRIYGAIPEFSRDSSTAWMLHYLGAREANSLMSRRTASVEFE